MPQLNPTPWLYLLLLSWITMMLYMAKTAKMTFHNNPVMPKKPTTKTFWPWPWQ